MDLSAINLLTYSDQTLGVFLILINLLLSVCVGNSVYNKSLVSKINTNIAILLLLHLFLLAFSGTIFSAMYVIGNKFYLSVGIFQILITIVEHKIFTKLIENQPHILKEAI